MHFEQKAVKLKTMHCCQRNNTFKLQTIYCMRAVILYDSHMCALLLVTRVHNLLLRMYCTLASKF